MGFTPSEGSKAEQLPSPCRELSLSSLGPSSTVASWSRPQARPGDCVNWDRNRQRKRAGALRAADGNQDPRSVMLADRQPVAVIVNALEQSRRSCTKYWRYVRTLTSPTGGAAAGTEYRASVCGLHVLLSETLNAIGLALDIIGFLILFLLAFPALMRRDFVASDRVDLDGVGVDAGQVERLMDPESAKRQEQRRRRRQTLCYWAGGSAVLIGFALQFAALFVR